MTVATREQLLEDVEWATTKLREAKARYETAILKAAAENITNVAIARAAGVSEAAIRMYVKRKLMMRRL